MKDAVKSSLKRDFSKKYISLSKDEFYELGNLINEIINEFELTLEKKNTRERELVAILNSITSPVFIVDSKGKLILRNNASNTLIRKFEEKERKYYYYELISRDEINEIIRSALKGGEIKIRKISFNREVFEVQVFPFESKNDNYFLIMMQNISEREKLSEMQKDFVSSISHEVRTPLSVIMGTIEILKDEKALKKGNEKYLSSIEENALRINNLITKLVELNELRDFEKKFSKVNLSDVISEISGKFKETASTKGINLSIYSEDVYVEGDYFLLFELLSNLVDNALKYTKEGNVEVKAFKEGDSAVILVKDTGVGISQDFLGNIFEPFTRENFAKKETGLGLGLAIVKRITELHKGEISVKSKVNFGTEFSVKLPLLRNINGELN